MEIYGFSTGRVRGKRADRGARRWLPGGWSEHADPINVFAISHPEGLCLFDTGQTAAAARRGYFPRWHPFFRLARFELVPEDEAAQQLRRLGLDPSSVRWVVLSHLHTDHLGGLAAFRSADVLVSRVEWERARGLAGRVRGYLPQRWPAGLEPRLVDFGGGPVGPFPASHDVAGDGRLVVVPFAGHTPGHQALIVRDGSRAALCVGDGTVSDPGLVRFCREEAVVVLAAHDPEAPARV